MTEASYDLISAITETVNVSASQVKKVLALLDEGNTIPFIARYRKEATENLDEVQIRDIEQRRDYVVALEDRRATILESIESQGKLTDDLKAKIVECQSKTALEDLYLPYKPKRRTKAMIAREKGLEPLAERILAQPKEGNPEEEAQAFVDEDKGVADVAAALEGAGHIVAEVISENAEIRAFVRDVFTKEGILVSTVKPEFENKPSKWNQYYEFSEAIKSIPSHRYLAIKRGEREDVLRVELEVEEDKIHHEILRLMNLVPTSPFAQYLESSAEDSYKRLIAFSIETDVLVDLKMQSDEKAIDIFAQNLETLLLSSPLGGKTVIGIDPGLRTGCKCAAVSSTGKYLETMTIYLTSGMAQEERARIELGHFILKHNPEAIAIGNGTGNRETEAFVREVLKANNMKDIIVIQVNEAGASVYSASDVAREEFPDIDLTIRGAISIARRLQDPLAELVKIDPKSIGVGQYQHDVYQPALERKLHEVVESCVNRVGVELNTASFSLLSYVAGIGPSLAKKVVDHRNANGAFAGRDQIQSVSGLGPKAFEQAAGFLRIRGAKNPLDASSVHPERYHFVEDIAKDLGVSLEELVGNAASAEMINFDKYKSDEVGEHTLRDIVDELKKPGRDPRKEFEPPAFREDVTTMEDLKIGMVLEGVVTNVTAFGAFVDVGVHQDGLVHLSELSETFVKEPSEVVSTGDKLKVQVLNVDLERKRISLSARIGKGEKGDIIKQTSPGKGKGRGAKVPTQRKKETFSNNPFAGL